MSSDKKESRLAARLRLSRGRCWAAQAGQTVIEILVTLAVVGILVSLLVTYTRTGELHSRLRRETDRVALDLRRAQEFAIFTREFDPDGQGPLPPIIPCGYGVHLDNDSTEYIIFGDLAPGLDCTSANGRRHPNGSEDVELVKLEEGIKILSSNASDVVFVPPEPITTMHPPPVQEALITLAIIRNPSLTRQVRVKKSGQINVITP